MWILCAELCVPSELPPYHTLGGGGDTVFIPHFPGAQKSLSRQDSGTAGTLSEPPVLSTSTLSCKHCLSEREGMGALRAVVLCWGSSWCLVGSTFLLTRGTVPTMTIPDAPRLCLTSPRGGGGVGAESLPYHCSKSLKLPLLCMQLKLCAPHI